MVMWPNFQLTNTECFVLRKTNVKQVIIIKKNGINLHVIQQKEKTFLQNTDRICTRIDRFPGKRFLKIGKTTCYSLF